MTDLGYILVGWLGTAIAISAYAARLHTRLARVEARTQRVRHS